MAWEVSSVCLQLVTESFHHCGLLLLLHPFCWISTATVSVVVSECGLGFSCLSSDAGSSWAWDPSTIPLLSHSSNCLSNVFSMIIGMSLSYCHSYKLDLCFQASLFEDFAHMWNSNSMFNSNNCHISHPLHHVLVILSSKVRFLFQPNCYSRTISISGNDHIIIFAKRDIKQWEELTYDYRFASKDQWLACYCGFPRCRGVVNDAESVEREKGIYVPRSELKDWEGE